MNRDVPYSFGKIEEIKDGKILIRYSQYAYSHENAASKAAKISKGAYKESLDPEIFKLTRAEFKNLNIQSLIRDQNHSEKSD